MKTLTNSAAYALDAKYQFRSDNTEGYTHEQRAMMNRVLSERMAAFRDIEGEDAFHDALKFNSERTLRDFDNGKLV